VIIGSGSSRVSQDPLYGHLVGGHRRQHSSSRTPNLAESIYGGLGHSTPRTSSFDTRHIHGQHPYAFAAVKHRTPTHDSLAEDRLDDLWSMHGVGGSAHLGAGVTGQLAAASLNGEDSWNTSPGNTLLSEVLDTSSYFTAAMNSDQLFTVDPSLQPRGYDVHNPFGLFGASQQSSHQDEVDMDAIDNSLEVHEDSPTSEEQEVAAGRRSTSADSNATAAPSHDHDSKLQADVDDHDEERDASTSDHENHDDDKAQKPTTTNNFVRKLHQMISDPKAADFIWWTELGTRHVVECCTNTLWLTYRSFVVSSAGEFSRSILGQHFKHNNVCGSCVIDLRARTNLFSVF
jgi:HSF-type DNA-binding